MLLETRIGGKVPLFVDCETVGGFDKGGGAGGFDPDEVVENVVKTASGLAQALAASATGAAEARPVPAAIELEFGLRVDSNAMISVAQNPSQGQFKVRVRWGG
ncbi:MAG: hypothetical protein JNM72_06555 [Deltaproteobacteria bacterium]|jgi:hypothetical protein|nr:hypothetical protein [Deltaproteobacteria bacterium]